MKKEVLNLAKGSPKFMVPYWRNLDTLIKSGKIATENSYAYVSMNFPPEFAMDYVFGGTDKLKDTVKRIHKITGNVDLENKNIVIGNGSTQIIIAAMFAYSQKYKNDSIYVKRPYYFRFPDFAKATSLKFLDDSAGLLLKFMYNPIEIVVSPNNPDNNLHFPELKKADQKIYDLSYQWPQYVDIIKKLNEDIMVFSMSKSTGHAATRVGWGFVKDPEIATIMEDYIENTTVGISNEGQERARLLLSIQSDLLERNLGEDCFSYGKEVLQERWELFLDAAKNVEFEILNPLKNGMFAWCRTKDGSDGSEYMLKKYSVTSKKGEISGMPNSYFRLNIGCDRWTFDEFCSRLKG
ncbi:aminotransferase class I/II-fold pyridoxal phosphate-dependent enzyme [bacterium]|nr:aminotransferase class I/II-fold pyridoxal phosphate-dependent enzyme [bacterium]